MHAAFKAWDRASEPLETTELRIHDGAPLEGLPKRAHWYLNTLRHLFPWTIPQPGAVLLDVGSGLGYVMEAALAQFEPRRVIGLDVAPSMIEKAMCPPSRGRSGSRLSSASDRLISARISR